MDAFNTPAADTRSPAEKLLESLAKTRRNLALVDAVKRRDWADAAKLQGEGADFLHRDRAALKALSGCDEAGAADLLQKVNLPAYPQPYGYTLVAAIKNNNRATFDHILQKPTDDRLLNDALFTALREDKADMADVLLKRLAPERFNDAVVFALMVHRPDAYDKLVTRFPDMQDSLMLFANSCAINDVPAMEKSLQMLLKESDTVLKRLRADDWFDLHRGAAIMRDVAMHLLDTGHIPTIDAFIDAFDSDLLPAFLMVSSAASMAVEHPKLLPYIIDKMQVSGSFAAAIVASSAHAPSRVEAARIIIDKFPEDAKQGAPALLRLLASAPDEKPFVEAQQNGLEMPAEGKQRAAILAVALGARNEKLAAIVEQDMKFTPEEIDTLQAAANIAAQAKAAEKTGDWHAKEDQLFWTALSDKRRDIADRVPDDVALQPPATWRLSYALGPLIAAGDFDYLGKVLARTAWTEETAKAAFEACIHSPEAVKQADVLQRLPKTLDDSDINRIVVKGDKGGDVLAALLERGYVLDDKTASYALTRALVQDCKETAGYLLASGVPLGNGVKDAHATALEGGAGVETLDMAERWIVRAQKQPAPVLQTGDVEKQAVAAAYGDCMAALLKGADAAFNPESLAAIKDAKGNNVLEILGAHGKLSDILVPELWRERSAESFIKAHTPPCYHAQCDFAGLTAGIAQILLKERATGLKFKLK